MKHIGFGLNTKIFHPYGNTAFHELGVLYNIFNSNEYNANRKRPYGYKTIMGFSEYNDTQFQIDDRRDISEIKGNRESIRSIKSHPNTQACIVYIQQNFSMNYAYSFICGIDQEIYTHNGFMTPKQIMNLAVEHGGYLGMTFHNRYAQSSYFSYTDQAPIESIAYLGPKTLYSIEMRSVFPIRVDQIIALPQTVKNSKNLEIY